ncbi:uncharacterized protein P174DRAFT_85253 [Aspergillus novofumigatus IBT 16806]|uniref:Uncharacterized protein n=1 Tax=Aspergillus novofumigatus (strain IBT 16806) TaxID=1392255 RepID=A0A2I1CGC7_ASPN1|nr:uncharacterized protein P174DRAFT_85253 [Aspergillus novofumigatus IBT 16806]PKX96664.1 hypothetical protein P174DRAFT_85253 [Aspergillus novofumigatus IBT 16806]
MEVCTYVITNSYSVDETCGCVMFTITIIFPPLNLYLVTVPVRYRSVLTKLGLEKRKLLFFCVPFAFFRSSHGADRLILHTKVCLNSHSSPLVSSRLADFYYSFFLSTFQLSSIASVSVQSGLLNLQSDNRPRPPRPPLVPVPKAA